MDSSIALTVVAAGIPIAASLILWLGDAGISERHHSHHDTYTVSGTLTWSLVFTMIVMGSLGILLGWLCVLDAFTANSAVVMSFFDAFLVVSFLYWVLLRRYKVVTYDDHMDLTPLFGHTISISYADIKSMEFVSSTLQPSVRNLHVTVGQKRRVLLWGVLDLDQILIRIDRYDAIEDFIAYR
ncbi:MAG: hypothetical protein IKF78_10925 [Atopobiaceae bacterium]|nr:hypothetical protein [Atopobiaceae bacterium]